MIIALYAWIVDDPSGKHGLMGFPNYTMGGIEMQAVSAKLENANKLKPVVEQVAHDKGITLPIKLVKFTMSEIIDSIRSEPE